MENTDLTPLEAEALGALRKHHEGISAPLDGEGRQWADVYLDNAIPRGWNPRQWAGVLGSLSKKGLYREVDGYAWGEVVLL